MGRIVAIDYGKKRVGIAVTDPLQIIATSLTTVDTKDLFEFLKTYSNKEKIETFVVGLAKNTDNTNSESMQYITPFVAKLKSAFPEIKVEMYDERFTSKLAFKAMIDGGMKKKDRQNKSTIDKIAATILLQDYLEYTKH